MRGPGWAGALFYPSPLRGELAQTLAPDRALAAHRSSLRWVRLRVSFLHPTLGPAPEFGRKVLEEPQGVTHSMIRSFGSKWVRESRPSRFTTWKG